MTGSLVYHGPSETAPNALEVRTLTVPLQRTVYVMNVCWERTKLTIKTTVRPGPTSRLTIASRLVETIFLYQGPTLPILTVSNAHMVQRTRLGTSVSIATT
jgi:hypothetical protein